MISTCLTRGQNVSLSAVSGKDHVVVRDGRQMAWHLWKHLLALMKQADKLWLWPALQWQLGAHCISSQILLCFDHRSNIGQKEKQWPENTAFGELTAPWDQLFLFSAKGLGFFDFRKSSWLIPRLKMVRFANIVHSSCQFHCHWVCSL